MRPKTPGTAGDCSRISRSRRRLSATTSTTSANVASSSSTHSQTGDVALITDAGTPAVSDPGADLVTAALAAGHRVSPIPGPSAVAAAVSASGLIDGPFLTIGFLPRERGERLRLLARAATTGFPLVLFESAQRLGRTLHELVEILGDRRAVMLRELTKIHEEVRAGSLSALREWAADAGPRGEIALVIAAAPVAATSESDAEAVVRTLRRSGLSASQAAREAAAITGLPRSELYKLAMAVGRRRVSRVGRRACVAGSGCFAGFPRQSRTSRVTRVPS